MKTFMVILDSPATFGLQEPARLATEVVQADTYGVDDHEILCLYVEGSPVAAFRQWLGIKEAPDKRGSAE